MYLSYVHFTFPKKFWKDLVRAKMKTHWTKKISLYNFYYSTIGLLTVVWIQNRFFPEKN